MLEFFQNKLSKFGNFQLRDYAFSSCFFKETFPAQVSKAVQLHKRFFYMNIKRDREMAQQLSEISSSGQLLENQELDANPYATTLLT